MADLNRTKQLQDVAQEVGRSGKLQVIKVHNSAYVPATTLVVLVVISD